MRDAFGLLERTPAVLNALVRDLPEVWTERNEGESTWTVFDIVGHLINGERTNWVPRLKMILEFGDTRAFEPFDRLAQQGEREATSLPARLDLFARLRRESLADVRALNLQASDLKRRGRHPALGVVTLEQLISTWVVHDLTHLHQISRVMAHQYRGAVGPWGSYLGVLQCSGHSAP